MRLFLILAFVTGCNGDFDHGRYMESVARKAQGEEVCYYSETPKSGFNGYYCIREVSYQYIKSKQKSLHRSRIHE